MTPHEDKAPTARNAANATLDVVPAMMFMLRSIASKHCDAAFTIPQLRAMGFLRRYPNQPLTELSKQLGLTVSATSRLVDGLVSRGLMTRAVPPENRRKIALSLTPTGQDVLRKTITATQAELAEKLAALTPQQLTSIVDTMDVLRSILGEFAGERP